MIAIFDYGAGNLRSVQNTLGALGWEYQLVRDAAGLEEIVVTAERREESVQNVGIAISVLSGDTLAAKSITIVNDLQNAVPSLQIEPAFGRSPTAPTTCQSLSAVISLQAAAIMPDHLDASLPRHEPPPSPG